MNYLATGEAPPAGSIDAIAVWQRIKDRLKEKLGIYKMPSGVPAVVGGKTYPLLTRVQANALYKALGALGDDMSDQLQKAGRSTSRVTSANFSLSGNFIDWTLEDRFGDQKFLGKYLFTAQVRDLLRIFDRYAIDLSVAQWAGYNIETSVDRAIGVLPGPLQWVFKAGIKTAEWVASGAPLNLMPKIPDFGKIVEIIKWGSIGGGLFILYWYVLRPKKK